MDANILKIKRVLVYVLRWLYVLSNTEATLEAQLIQKLSNTEAQLKKSVAYKKACILMKNICQLRQLCFNGRV